MTIFLKHSTNVILSEFKCRVGNICIVNSGAASNLCIYNTVNCGLCYCFSLHNCCYVETEIHLSHPSAENYKWTHFAYSAAKLSGMDTHLQVISCHVSTSDRLSMLVECIWFNWECSSAVVLKKYASWTCHL